MLGIPDGSVSNGYKKRGRKPGRRTDFTNDPEVNAKTKKHSPERRLRNDVCETIDTDGRYVILVLCQ